MTTLNPFPTDRENRQLHLTTTTKISNPLPEEEAQDVNISPTTDQQQQQVEQQQHPHPYFKNKTLKQAFLSSPQKDASLQAEQELNTTIIPLKPSKAEPGGEALEGEQKQHLLKEKKLLTEEAQATKTPSTLHTQPSPLVEMNINMNTITNKMPRLYSAAKDSLTFLTAHVYIVLGVLVTVWPAWKLLYWGATKLFQDFAPILLISGGIAAAATVLGYLLYRSPLEDVSLAQAEESSIVSEQSAMAAAAGRGGGGVEDESTLMDHSEPVSGASIEDLITSNPKKGKAEGDEEEHHGIYERALEFLDPGKEMVGDLIIESEEQGEGERDGGENVIGTSNKDGESSGYQSDSDVPGMVLQGVHHK